MNVRKVLAITAAAILVISVGGLAISSLRSSSPVPYTQTTDEGSDTFSFSAADTTNSTKIAESTTDFQTVSTQTTSEKQSTSGQNIGSDYKYAYAGFTPAIADTSAQWNLLLINREYILPDNYKVKLDNCIEGDDDSLSLDYRVAPHYSEMYYAAKADGITLTPISGYRSVTRQTNNFERKISYFMDQGFSRTEATKKAARTILPPGTSEHNAGLAMDIISLETSFEDTAAFSWLEKNAADYGFILRYPAEKTDITHISYEPWHWRYVGVQAAKEMEKSGQCLEEYLGVA